MYLLDGYNVLFSLTLSDRPLKVQRHHIIHFLQKRFAALHLKGILIFDAKVRLTEESGRAYQSPLEIIYTPKGQTADSYIEETIAFAKNPRQMIVVTNDRALIANVKSLGAQTLKNEEFLKRLAAKKSQAPEKEITDTKQNITRLLKIFEKKLLDDK